MSGLIGLTLLSHSPLDESRVIDRVVKTIECHQRESELPRGERGFVAKHGIKQLTALAKDHDIYKLTYKIKQPLQKRIMANADAVMERFDNLSWRRKFESRLPR